MVIQLCTFQLGSWSLFLILFWFSPLLSFACTICYMFLAYLSDYSCAPSNPFSLLLLECSNVQTFMKTFQGLHIFYNIKPVCFAWLMLSSLTWSLASFQFHLLPLHSGNYLYLRTLRTALCFWMFFLSFPGMLLFFLILWLKPNFSFRLKVITSSRESFLTYEAFFCAPAAFIIFILYCYFNLFCPLFLPY